MDHNKSVIETIKNQYQHMFTAERKVADQILANPDLTVSMNVSELADAAGVSDATVIRMCKHLGFEGFYQMKLYLARNLGQHQLIGYKGDSNDPETAKTILQGISRNIIGMAERLDADLVVGCAALIRNCDYVHIAATGNTAPVAADLAFRLGRLGKRTNSSMIPEYYMSNISMGSRRDVIICISHSGSSKHVIQALEIGRDRGMKSIVVTDHITSPAAHMADYILDTSIDDPLYSEFGTASHVYMSAMLDALVYFVANGSNAGSGDDIEIMLAEYKL